MRLIADNSKDAAREIARMYDMRLSFDALSALTALLQPKKFRHRTFILEQGEQSASIAFVAKGLIRQYKPDDELDIVEDICHEGDMLFCAESTIGRQESELCIQTLEPTIIYEMDYDELKEQAVKLPEIQELFCRILESHILKQTARLHELDKDPLTRYINLLHEPSEIVRRTPLKYVASYLRMAPETLSRVRNKVNRNEEVTKKK
jgi:CRP-like cAMP-binding protein